MKNGIGNKLYTDYRRYTGYIGGRLDLLSTPEYNCELIAKQLREITLWMDRVEQNLRSDKVWNSAKARGYHVHVPADFLDIIKSTNKNARGYVYVSSVEPSRKERELSRENLSIVRKAVELINKNLSSRQPMFYGLSLPIDCSNIVRDADLVLYEHVDVDFCPGCHTCFSSDVERDYHHLMYNDYCSSIARFKNDNRSSDSMRLKDVLDAYVPASAKRELLGALMSKIKLPFDKHGDVVIPQHLAVLVESYYKYDVCNISSLDQLVESMVNVGI